MPRTPNREQGQLVVDSILLESPTQDYGPQRPGELRMVDGRAIFKDTLGDFDVRYGTLPADQHEALDTLTHLIAEPNYIEVTRVDERITAVTVWTSAQKTRKIRESTVGRTNGLLSQLVTTHYDAQGAPLSTLTRTVTRNASNRIAGITTTKS